MHDQSITNNNPNYINQVLNTYKKYINDKNYISRMAYLLQQ